MKRARPGISDITGGFPGRPEFLRGAKSYERDIKRGGNARLSDTGFEKRDFGHSGVLSEKMIVRERYPTYYVSGRTDGPEQAGVDKALGIYLFGGDANAWLSVMRAYAASTPSILNGLRSVTAETLQEYAVAVQGLVGSSRNIGAEEAGEAAAELAAVAKDGDLERVLELNEPFIGQMERLLAETRAILDEHGTVPEKPRLRAPNRALLALLRTYLENYDMDGIDMAMLELESSDYDADGPLVKWLRERIDALDFSVAAERLVKYYSCF